MRKMVDVAIIGAGHAGLNAVKEVRKVTQNFVLINGGDLGTTCARVGCMPSKLALQVAQDYQRRYLYKRYGISGSDNMQIDIHQTLEHIRDIRDTFVDLILANSTDNMDEEFISGYAELLEPNVIRVEGHTLYAKRVIIATGSRTYVPPQWQKYGDRVLTSENLFEQVDLPRTIAVLGLGPIGVEIGQVLHHLGLEVTGVEGLTNISRLEDPVINQVAVETLGREFPMWLGQRAEIEQQGDQLKVLAGERSIGVDKLFVSVGRIPNLDRLGLERLGVEIEGRSVRGFNPQTLQVGDLPMFIAGDANGMNTTLQGAREEGMMAGYNAVQDRPAAFKRKTRFTIVFSEPNIVTVGASWSELIPEHIAIGQARFGPVGRALIMGKNRGMIRIYGDKCNAKILGTSMIGPRCEHLAHLLAWSIEQNLGAVDMLRMPYYHPVIEEVLQDALHDLVKKTNNVSIEMVDFKKAQPPWYQGTIKCSEGAYEEKPRNSKQYASNISP